MIFRVNVFFGCFVFGLLGGVVALDLLVDVFFF